MSAVSTSVPARDKAARHMISTDDGSEVLYGMTSPVTESTYDQFSSEPATVSHSVSKAPPRRSQFAFSLGGGESSIQESTLDELSSVRTAQVADLGGHSVTFEQSSKPLLSRSSLPPEPRPRARAALSSDLSTRQTTTMSYRTEPVMQEQTRRGRRDKMKMKMKERRDMTVEESEMEAFLLDGGESSIQESTLDELSSLRTAQVADLGGHSVTFEQSSKPLLSRSSLPPEPRPRARVSVQTKQKESATKASHIPVRTAASVISEDVDDMARLNALSDRIATLKERSVCINSLASEESSLYMDMLIGSCRSEKPSGVVKERQSPEPLVMASEEVGLDLMAEEAGYDVAMFADDASEHFDYVPTAEVAYAAAAGKFTEQFDGAKSVRDASDGVPSSDHISRDQEYKSARRVSPSCSVTRLNVRRKKVSDSELFSADNESVPYPMATTTTWAFGGKMPQQPAVDETESMSRDERHDIAAARYYSDFSSKQKKKKMMMKEMDVAVPFSASFNSVTSEVPSDGKRLRGDVTYDEVVCAAEGGEFVESMQRLTPVFRSVDHGIDLVIRQSSRTKPAFPLSQVQQMSSGTEAGFFDSVQSSAVTEEMTISDQAPTWSTRGKSLLPAQMNLCKMYSSKDHYSLADLGNRQGKNSPPKKLQVALEAI